MTSTTHEPATGSWMQIVKLLNYIELEGDINEENVVKVLEKFDILPREPRQVHVKGNWHQFKQFHVYSLDKRPLFFIKEMWETELFKEILGLHFGIHFFDPDLCIKNYMFGRWHRQGKEDKPVLITSYVNGNALQRKQFNDFHYELGRQHAFHQVLSLYDVDWRHFIISRGTLVRIDLGRSFRNLAINYQGFWDFNYSKLERSDAFNKGVAHEFETIRKNTERNKGHIQLLLSRLERFGDASNLFVDFSLPEFVRMLRDYWRREVPFPVA